MSLFRMGCSGRHKVVVLACALLVIGVCSSAAFGQTYQAWPPVSAKESPKVQQVLQGLIEEASAGRPVAQIISSLRDASGGSFLSRYAVNLEQNMIQVVIEGSSDQSVKGIESAVVGLGGQVEVSFESLVQVLVPMDRIEEVSGLPGVSFVRLPVRAQMSDSTIPMKSAQPNTGSFVTEGKATINAPAWHQAGFTGEGIKVAVNDVGFRGYSGVLGRELPPRERVITRSFRADRDLECRQCSATGQEHGLAVAEIIYDLAPGATFYLVNFGTDVEARQSVNYLIQQDVDVINTSWGLPSGCFRAGGGMLEPVFQQARNAGVTWAASAGNNADIHWQGGWTDNNANNKTEFSGGDETFTMNAKFFAATIDGQQVAAVSFFFLFSWDAPCTGASDDYNIEIYPQDEPTFLQEGDWFWNPGVPIKYVGGTFFIRNTSLVGQVDVWQVVIKKKRPEADNARLDVVFDVCADCTGGDNYYLKSGSVSIYEPTTSPNVISVGAVHQAPERCPKVYCPDGHLLFYSSLGPTKDGRRKPDISAPSHVSTFAFGRFTGHASTQNDGFGGTSASSPHVAGAAALVIQALRAKAEPNTPEDIQAFLAGRAEDLGANGPDNQYGAGLLYLGQPPVTPPTIISIEPKSGLQGATLDATISGTSLAGATAVTFSGAGVTATIREGGSATSLPITITIAPNAEPGDRTFTVTAPAGSAQSGNVVFSVLQAPLIAVEPASLSFTATEGAANPDSQTLRVSNTGGGTLNWKAVVSTEAAWLTASPSEGVAPSDVEAKVNITGLAAGSYQGQITFTGTDATNNPVVVGVTLNIKASEPKPLPFTADPASLTFDAVVGEAAPASQTIQITNHGDAAIAWAAVRLSVGSEPSWFSVSTEGAATTLQPGASTSVSVSINLAGLAAGVYKGAVVFIGEGNYVELSVPVTLNLSAQSGATEGELIALVFKKLEFVIPEDWERTLRDGCVVYKNISGGSSLIRITLPDESVVEYDIPADHEVIVCGDVVHIDTRTQPPVPVNNNDDKS